MRRGWQGSVQNTESQTAQWVRPFYNNEEVHMGGKEKAHALLVFPVNHIHHEFGECTRFQPKRGFCHIWNE